ncbi:MAG: rRNA (pseudouridine1915-N3)-methyltransferase [Clostridia bacterium]|nr:rRNA (pseudouridine1915-N3)-methyltransferase [Clostridia bacterium]
MQHVYIIAVGKVKEKYLTAGIKEYLKRLNKYARIHILEGPDEKVPDKLNPTLVAQILATEGQGIKRLLPPDCYKIALDREGTMLSSEELSNKLSELALGGQNKVAFIIGGTLGLDQEILKQSDLRLSFSRLTFPHQLIRLFLLEQVYRAYKIQRGETYHR